MFNNKRFNSFVLAYIAVNIFNAATVMIFDLERFDIQTKILFTFVCLWIAEDSTNEK